MQVLAEKKSTFAELLKRVQSAKHHVFPDPDGNFEHAELNALCAVWRQKAKDGLPLRSDFGIRDLARYLSHITIVERDAAGRYRYRLFGSSLVAIVGECTGKYADECFSKERYAVWKADFDLALEYNGPLRYVSYYETPLISYLIGESFAAPLANPEGGAPNTILAAAYVKAKIGAPPRSAYAADNAD